MITCILKTIWGFFKAILIILAWAVGVAIFFIPTWYLITLSPCDSFGCRFSYVALTFIFWFCLGFVFERTMEAYDVAKANLYRKEHKKYVENMNSKEN